MKISDDVMRVLSRAKISGDKVVLTGQLDRKLYLDTNKVLEACGGRWNRKAKAHVFEVDPAELLEVAMSEGHVVDRVKELQFFATPAALAKRIATKLDIKPGDLCLEPSAGTGNIARAMKDMNGAVVCVERDEKMRDALRADFEVSDEDDFMLCPASPVYDHVGMNPPFRRVGEGDCLSHVMHAAAMLRPGGNICSVLPSSVMFREDRRYREFRGWVDRQKGSLEDLDDGSFKESGTLVRAVLLYVASVR